MSAAEGRSIGTVLLLANRQREFALRSAQAVERALRELGVVVERIARAEDMPTRAGGAHVGMVVAVGGDGTLLAAARHAVRLDAPVLGINAGSLGFLAQFDATSFAEQAQQIMVEGRFELARPMMLSASVIAADGMRRLEKGLAVNEALVTAGPPYRMIELGVSIDGQPGPVLSGDGLLVSTPTGSTAYNVSAGGPIVAPGCEVLAITPIAAHTLAFRPIVVPGSSAVRVMVRRANGLEGASDGGSSEGGTCLVLDGEVACALRAGDVVEIAAASERPRIVANPRSSYWATLQDKLHWALEPRKINAGSGGR